MHIERSERLQQLPPYLFVQIDRAKQKARKEGRDIIDLGVGDPDMPTPSFIIEELTRAIQDPSTHRYALDAGMPKLREAIATWYKGRFGVTLDPAREILPLIGSKEGIAHMPLAFVNRGDVVLVPDPCYPPYRSGTIFAGGKPVMMPLTEDHGFLPDLRAIKPSIAAKARMIFLNYPNNPTNATGTVEFFKDVIHFAEKNNVIVCHDAAYSEMTYDGYRAPSFLEVPGAKNVGVEFHSLSKTYNMTGWRIGFACGNKDVIAALASVKANIDSGIFTAIQRAGIAALTRGDESVSRMRGVYQERRDALIDGLNRIGWNVKKPKATFYIWTPTLKGKDSRAMAKFLLDEADIIVTPGVGFGSSGEGYIRMALTVGTERLTQAVERIKKVL
jgi:LL-diaminopimelate aminotransferase